MRFIFTLLFLSSSFLMMSMSKPGDMPMLKERIEVNIYPNPSTNGQFSIKLTQLQRSDKVVVKVYNLIGSEVYSHSFSSHLGEYKHLISLTSAPKGMYMVEVSLGSEKYTRRLSLL